MEVNILRLIFIFLLVLVICFLNLRLSFCFFDGKWCWCEEVDGFYVLEIIIVIILGLYGNFS